MSYDDEDFDIDDFLDDEDDSDYSGESDFVSDYSDESDFGDDEEVEVMLIEDEELFIRGMQKHLNKVIAKDTIEAGDLDSYMTLEQIRSMAREWYIGLDPESGHPVMTAEVYEEMVLALSRAFLGSCLAKLASKGLVESAWDPEANEAVFWRKAEKDGD